jgi:uncharacterized protein DUF4124
LRSLGRLVMNAQDAGMRLSAGSLLVAISCALPVANAANEVTIYRCTDHAGRLTLRDTPCGKDQAQQTRTMLRPKDAPQAPTMMSKPPRDTIVAPAPRVVVVHAPRPLYECIPPDGEPYTSENGEGRPRWVPLWTLDYPMPIDSYANTSSTTGLAITTGGVRIDGGSTSLSPPRYGAAALYAAGTWIRDECHALPQDEVCARLEDRRDAIRRRFFNAMPNERDVLRVEERGVNARLANDCGAS